MPGASAVPQLHDQRDIHRLISSKELRSWPSIFGHVQSCSGRVTDE